MATNSINAATFSMLKEKMLHVLWTLNVNIVTYV